MKLIYKKFILIMAACLLTTTVYANPVKAVTDANSLKWVEVKDGMPAGAKAAVLAGDPTKKEFFIVRLQLPANYTVPVHSHPIDEYDTVISGTYYLGVGEKITDQTMQLAPGSFVKIPAKVAHYGTTKDETIIEISGIGPWGMIYPKKTA